MNSTWRVATGHEKTTYAAQCVLEAGGNAFDAAVAAVLAACVAEPLLCSPGGGGYALIQRPGRAPQVLDFFVQTPRRRHPGEFDFYPITGDFGPDTQEFHIGLASIATPGMVAGLFELHGRYGHMPMTEVTAPAVELAREGVVLNEVQAYTLQILEPIVRAGDDAARLFNMTGGAAPVPAVGTRIANPELAGFLAQLAREGGRFFYDGEPARAIVAACRERGGHLRLPDLQRYRPVWRRPLAWRYRGARCWSNPPPALGGVLVALATLELENRLGQEEKFGSLSHLRALVGALTATGRQRARLTRPEHLACPRELLNAWRAACRQPANTRGTTHISIRDTDGALVGVTVSNGEGSGFVVPGTGVMLNNMLGEEDLNVGSFHRWPVNRRMASMMAPTLVRHGEQRTLLGSGGSNRIRSTLAQVISNRVDFGMDLSAAVRAPRLHVEDRRVAFEAFAGGYSARAMAWLHRPSPAPRAWPRPNLYFGGVHTISDCDQAADTRRGGRANSAELE